MSGRGALDWLGSGDDVGDSRASLTFLVEKALEPGGINV